MPLYYKVRKNDVRFDLENFAYILKYANPS